ncbi:MAG: SIMPL domain-containing protein [Rhodocyclaceae bacterium]
MKKVIAITACSLACLSGGALAQTTLPKAEWPTASLSAEASRPAPNDMGHVTVYVEDTGNNPADLARKINQRIGNALALTKPYDSVKTQSAGTQTYPIYTKNSTRIESWRMRSELSLESKDLAALSELTGKLQSIAAVEQLTLAPSPETQKRVADDAMVDAIKAFEARAEVVARALGKRYRIKKLNINTNGGRPVYLRQAPAAMKMDMAAAAPIEAGDSLVTVNVSGSVELID